jgi:hypothetical protein
MTVLELSQVSIAVRSMYFLSLNPDVLVTLAVYLDLQFKLWIRTLTLSTSGF